MEALDGPPERARVAADLIQRDQAVVAIEHRVFHALSHHRRGELLETRSEFSVQVDLVLHQQQLADEAKQLGIDFRTLARGLFHGQRHAAPVVLTRRAWPHVGPVDRHCGCDLPDRLLKLATGPVALVAVALADVDQQAGQALEVRSELADHHLLLGGSNQLGERL